MAIVSLALSCCAKAQFFTGTMTILVNPFSVSTSAFTNTSFSLNQLNLVTATETGTFASFVPALGFLTAYTGTVTGLSAIPVSTPISNFFVFSTPDVTLGASGTTPNNRFAFNLTNITETAYTVSTASFFGIGTLTDSQGSFSSTPAHFDLAYSSQGGYTIALTAGAVVPEPSTWAMLLGGIGFLFLGRMGIRKAVR